LAIATAAAATTTTATAIELVFFWMVCYGLFIAQLLASSIKNDY
jgi:hypothetical protein